MIPITNVPPTFYISITIAYKIRVLQEGGCGGRKIESHDRGLGNIMARERAGAPTDGRRHNACMTSRDRGRTKKEEPFVKTEPISLPLLSTASRQVGSNLDQGYGDAVNGMHRIAVRNGQCIAFKALPRYDEGWPASPQMAAWSDLRSE